MFKLTNVSAVVGSEEILKNINLTILPGNLSVVYGERGSGKTTLANLIAAHPRVTQTSGAVVNRGTNITSIETPARIRAGVFVTCQEPPEVDGLTNIETIARMLRIRDIKKSMAEIEDEYKTLSVALGLGKSYGKRPLNDAGAALVDIQKNEIIQAIMMDSAMTVFDSVDDLADDEDMALMASAINAYSIGRTCLVLSSRKEFVELLNLETISLLFDGEINVQIDATTFARTKNDA